MWRVVGITCLCWLAAGAQLQPVCQPYPVVDADQGKTVPTLPASYSAVMEVNKIEAKYSTDYIMSYDLPNGRAMLRVESGPVEFTEVLNFNTSELHLIYRKTKCLSKGIDESGYAAAWGKVKINGVNYDYSVPSQLKFDKAFGQKYMGTATVRGIPSHHWQSCLRTENPDSSYTMDYYFAIPEWTQTRGGSGMPVRSVGEGVHIMKGVSRKFKIIADFLSFAPYAEKDFRYYQIPEGIYCEGMKKSKAIPKLPESFKFSTETLMPYNSMNTGTIMNMELWYDHDHRLGRYDFGLPVPLSFLFDYRMGVRYMKNVAEGTCKMVPFGIWAPPPPGHKDNWLEMLDPSQIFFIDDTYQYTGQDVSRGIPCNRFISKKTFGPPSLAWNATLEYCIIDPHYVEIPKNSEVLTKDVPLWMIFRARDGEWTTRANHFDFEQMDYARDMKMFDVVDCYNTGLRKDIMITFEGNYFDRVAQYKGRFIKDIIARIAKVSQIPPLRVQRPKVDYDASNIYFTATLLDRVPFDVLFKRNEDGDKKGLISIEDSVENVQYEANCAEMCQDMVDDKGQPIKCNSFAYCFADNKCLMSSNHLADSGTVDLSDKCKVEAVRYYNRAVPAPDFANTRLSTGLTSLKNTVYGGRFYVYFRPNSGEEMKVFKASGLKTDFTRGDSGNTGTTIRDFKQMAGQSATEQYVKVVLDAGFSLEDCSYSCEHTSTFTCQSFTFCSTIGRCFLSEAHPEERSDMTVNTTQCDVYSRSYLQKFDMKRGMSLQQKDAVTLLDVNTPERCAVLCITQKDFSCKSFDYCPPSRTCRLNKQHYLDFPAKEGKLNPSPQCVHFSRKFVDDFRKTQSGQWIKLKDVNIIRGIRTDECAKSCVEQLGPECKGFDYCGNETYCVLSSDYYRQKGVGKVVTQDRAYCAHYTRTSFPDGSRYVPQKVNVNKGYSPGSMAGLAFAMLFVGMILSVLVAAIVFKVRGGSVDDMKTKFVNITNPNFNT